MKKLQSLLIIVVLLYTSIVWGQTTILPNFPIIGSTYYLIDSDELWDYDTEYNVTCNIVIKDGGSLTIIPQTGTGIGVNINMN